jgi:hypothetical protein
MEYEYSRQPSTIEGIITLLGILPISLLFALICITQVNQYCFNHRIYNKELDEKEAYVEKYPLEEASSSNDDTRQVNPNSYVMDYTPSGIIILKYDYDTERFFYWSNKKQVSYDILETIGRKYVTSYCCREVYIDRKKLQQEHNQLVEDKKRQLEEQEKMKQEDKENDEDTSSENSVFATFKSYNKPKTNNKKTTQETLNVCERSNTFVYKGRINEFELLQTEQYAEVDTRPKLDFEMFKRMFANTNNMSENDVETAIENVESNDVDEDENTESKKDV